MNQYNEYNKLRDIFILFLLISIYIKQEIRFNEFETRQEQSFDAITDIYMTIDTQYDVLKILVDEEPEIASVVIR